MEVFKHPEIRCIPVGTQITKSRNRNLFYLARLQVTQLLTWEYFGDICLPENHFLQQRWRETTRFHPIFSGCLRDGVNETVQQEVASCCSDLQAIGAAIKLNKHVSDSSCQLQLRNSFAWPSTLPWSFMNSIMVALGSLWKQQFETKYVDGSK